MKSIIFLSGLPRSGTKLLRNLLNNHDQISIPEIETVLIPYLTSKFGINYDLNKKENFYAVCREFEKSTFHHDFKKSNKDIQIHTLSNRTENITWAFFFEEILKFYGPKNYTEAIVVGDKTPGYIAHTDVLLDIWPNAKIIHIVRDPRDYVCSARNVWNKNLYRAANRWNQIMVDLDLKYNLNDNNFLTVYYEKLIESPKDVLTTICNFLNLQYQGQMINLKKPSENFGEAKGQTVILSSNKNKYRQLLTKKQIYKIEQIIAAGARIHGYQLTNENVSSKSINEINMFRYKMCDGLNSMLFHVKEKGLFTGIYYFFQLHKENI